MQACLQAPPSAGAKPRLLACRPCPAAAQLDVLPYLDTPREALTTAALLRLPTFMSREDKMERVEELLEVLVRGASDSGSRAGRAGGLALACTGTAACLPHVALRPWPVCSVARRPSTTLPLHQDLQKCADLMIGDAKIGIRGLSGGQCRRVTSEPRALPGGAAVRGWACLGLPADVCRAATQCLQRLHQPQPLSPHPPPPAPCSAVGIELIKNRALWGKLLACHRACQSRGLSDAACAFPALPRCYSVAHASLKPHRLLLTPARAASLILLDEPLSGLDSEMGEAVVQSLSRLTSQGRTIMLSVHSASA